MLITGISTDSRPEDQKGMLFIPIVGEQYDGHDYIKQALEHGAVAALSERDDCPDDPRVFKVRSTMETMHSLAADYRMRFKLKMVAITGSVGKTTTKDMIASVLEQRYKTLKTQGNLNNQIGLPQMVFRLEETYEAAILEMGMSHEGEIHNLSMITKPDIAVITNIGTAHIENFGGQQGILKAKIEIFHGMDADNCVVILNGDDPHLKDLTPPAKKIIYYGMDSYNDIYAGDISEYGLNGVGCRIFFRETNEKISIKIPFPGRHMVYNALAATAVGRSCGLSLAEIKKGIESFKPSVDRMEIIKSGSLTIINDVYNANPSSMEAALKVLAATPGTRTAILGDMFELGENSYNLHLSIGECAAKAGVHRLIAVGERSRGIFEGFRKNMSDAQTCLHYPDKESLISELGRGILFNPLETVLVKASRGMKFEYIKDAVRTYCLQEIAHSDSY